MIEDETEIFELEDPRLDELWVAIDGLPNYAVSNYGRVINVARGTEKIAAVGPGGFLRVILFRKNVAYTVYVHRLVAKAFFLNYRPGVEVRHINNDKTDNSVLNLTLAGKVRTGGII